MTENCLLSLAHVAMSTLTDTKILQQNVKTSVTKATRVGQGMS